MPLREAARRAGAGSPFCILCYLQSLSIFRFRLSKSTPAVRDGGGKFRDGGRTWTRTRDLFLIREAL